MDQSERYKRVIEAIDAANRADPRRELFDGVEYPRENLYSIRMTQWLERLVPDAPEALRIAARGQHVCRWIIPRDHYPMTRAGYLAWRTELGKFHAAKLAEILRPLGYDDQTIARVQSLVRKERLKSDGDAQALEDTICLVFLEHYLSEFAREHQDEQKLVTILRRTWKKMSPRGHAAARQLSFAPEIASLIQKALAGEGSEGKE